MSTVRRRPPIRGRRGRTRIPPPRRNPRLTTTATNKDTTARQLQLLQRKLQSMLDIERHHIISISHYDHDDLDVQSTWVDWCPRYQAVPGSRGGTALLHHTCRRCRRLCFHLLDRRTDGVSQRICLGCFFQQQQHNQDDESHPPGVVIPPWYFHTVGECPICKAALKRGERSRARGTKALL